jgi:hypothetical protein
MGHGYRDSVSGNQLHQGHPHGHQTEGYDGSGDIGSHRATSCPDGVRMSGGEVVTL